MKKNSISYVIIITFILVVIFFISGVLQKEETIKEGKLVLLELAPVDPRSLIQGDYMVLNYDIATSRSNIFRASAIASSGEQIEETDEDLKSETIENYEGMRGFVLLTLDENHVGHFIKLTDKLEEAEEGQLFIKFFNNNGWRFNIGAESFFFQEGEGDKFANAKYGALRVDEKGNSVLIGMYNENLELIH